MPELKEVFDMVTKQTEPDIDSWRDQEQRQRRTRDRLTPCVTFMAPSYSADGDLVLFHKPRGPYGDQQSWDLWSIPSGGGEPTLLQRDAQYGADLGNGRIVYLSVVGGQARGLWTAEFDGSDPAQLVRGNIDAPMLSPDRTRVAYQQDGSVYVVDVSTGETAFVIRGETPQWVDDGTLIVTPS